MQKYQSKILQNAIRLPAINWNLSSFGGHFQHVNAGWHVGIEQHLAFEVIQILSGQERVNLHRKSYLLNDGRYSDYPAQPGPRYYLCRRDGLFQLSL